MSNSIIWHGFDHQWKSTPHRLNGFGNYLDPVTTDPSGRATAQCTALMKIGQNGDKADAFTNVLGVESDVLQFVHGEETCIAAASMGFRNELGNVSVRRQLALPGGAQIAAAAILRGFEVRWQAVGDYDRGYYTRGFGFQLLNQRLSGNEFSFVAHCFIFPDHGPDLPPPLRKVIEEYRYSMKVYYTILFGAADKVRFTTGLEGIPTSFVQYSYDRDLPKYVLDGAGEPAASVQASMSGATRDFNQAFVAIRGFRWEVLPSELDKLGKILSIGRRKDGRYLRLLKASINQSNYNPGTGQISFNAELGFTNDGLASNPFHARHELFATLVQLQDPEAQTRAMRVHNFLDKQAVKDGATASQSVTVGGDRRSRRRGARRQAAGTAS